MVTPRLLRSAEIDSTAALLAAAMVDDPAYCFLFPGAADRARGLQEFFVRNLRVHLPHECTYVLSDGALVLATVTVRPPQGVPISTLTMLRRGLLPFALRHGATATRRLFTLKDAYDELETELANGKPHWHVHMMAVAPKKQGQGLGSALLKAVLAVTADDDDRPPCPTVLTTHKERNVIFYLRAQFDVVDERELTLSGNRAPYRVWGMRRRPRGAQT